MNFIRALLGDFLATPKPDAGRAGPYLYAGALTPDEIDWVQTMLRDYPWPVEVFMLPSVFYDWSRTALIDYDDTAEDCMGGSYSRKTKMYGWMHRTHSDSGFLFFASPGERSAYIAAFPSSVLDPEPFKTIIE